MGTLAGGIAHDFNNLLSGIVGNISLAKRNLPIKDKVFSILSKVEIASDRAQELTQRLLTFSTGGDPVKKAASIEELIRETVGFSLSGSKAKCDYTFSDDLWTVEVDEGQLSQVIQNLVINADQAMAESGEIKVLAENVIIEKDQIFPLQRGKYVRIVLIDQGIGIPEKFLSKIFDPFFTTKKKGNGLGLATALSVIRNHDGHITVESKAGAGTTFSIYLPASEKNVSKNKEVENAVCCGKGKILVMDDEELVREMLRGMLEDLGLEVELAEDGTAAIEKYLNAHRSGAFFDVVILDLTVKGGMGGKKAVEELHKIDPNVKAIVSSGYSNDPIMSNYESHGFRGVIRKPYKLDQLSHVIGDLLLPS